MSNKILHLSDDNFDETIADGITLVDFYATWCGPCRMITPIIEELSNMLDGKAKIGKLDIDQAPEVSKKCQISSVPTLILFKNGQEVKRVVGVKELDYLLNLINSYL
ncbi:MAG: thioredoxin [Parachlamydiaceae bacterium]|nr:thioredoxin [Parachlamydiaceae bacterium]